MTADFAGRRRALATGAASLLTGFGISGRHARADALPFDPRAALLRDGEAALARGDGLAAIDAFERAAAMKHEPRAELGIVRAHMQTGSYRQALAFCAHVAGAHLEAPAAAALYAWLLRTGAQEAAARQVLRSALERAAADPVVVAVEDAFSSGRQRPTGVLLEAPHRMAPVAFTHQGQAPPPSSASVVASGVLVSGGTRALVPASAVLGSAAERKPEIWVRNGLGQTTQAGLDLPGQPLQALGAVMLSLREPLDARGLVPWTGREPFAGSAGYVVGYAEVPEPTPAWPSMRQGFFGAAPESGILRQLGIDVVGSRHGGPVLDASGRLVGIALDGGNRRAVWLPARRWQIPAAYGEQEPVRQRESGAAAARTAPDEVYERALRLALQVIVPS